MGTWKQGGGGARHGVFITVRQKGEDGVWTTPIDSAVPTAEPPAP